MKIDSFENRKKEAGYECDREMKEYVLLTLTDYLHNNGWEVIYTDMFVDDKTQEVDIYLSGQSMTTGQIKGIRAEYKERQCSFGQYYGGEFFNEEKLTNKNKTGLIDDPNALPLWITTYANDPDVYVWNLKRTPPKDPKKTWNISKSTVEDKEKVQQKRLLLDYHDAKRIIGINNQEWTGKTPTN